MGICTVHSNGCQERSTFIKICISVDEFDRSECMIRFKILGCEHGSVLAGGSFGGALDYQHLDYHLQWNLRSRF